MVGPNDRIAIRDMRVRPTRADECMPTAKAARDVARRAKPEPDDIIRIAGDKSKTESERINAFKEAAMQRIVENGTITEFGQKIMAICREVMRDIDQSTDATLHKDIREAARSLYVTIELSGPGLF